MVVDRISLIAVEAADGRQIQAVDDHRFIEGDRRRQPTPDVGAVFFDPVVVAEEEEEPAVLVIPVSYTRLDVYKRQELHQGPGH